MIFAHVATAGVQEQKGYIMQGLCDTFEGKRGNDNIHKTPAVQSTCIKCTEQMHFATQYCVHMMHMHY